MHILICSISACSLWTRSNEGTVTGTSEPNSSDNSEGTRETEEIIRQLTLVCDNPSVVAASPDGSKIILRTGSISSFWINYYILDTEGEEKPVGIERPERYEIIGASFSPDGTKIIYLTIPEDMNKSDAKINLIHSDGNNQKTLATGYAPKFLKGGDEILYLSDGQRYRMNADGHSPAFAAGGE
ncbi:MAG: PD40 domain-containing protein [Clostridiales bacterium]|nr:PD40 domain-containing protein [Clostridiales bacterium]